MPLTADTPMYYLVTRLCCADDDGDWCDEDGSTAVTYIVFYTKVDARCDKLALVQDLGAMKTVSHTSCLTQRWTLGVINWR